jgi:polyhydroxybutyrate depolymerase
MSAVRIVILALAILGITATVPTTGTESLDAETTTAIPSAGCGVTTVREIDHEPGSMIVDGVERTWEIAAPTAHDGVHPVPLVLMLHGLAGSTGEIRFITGSGLHEQEGFVVVAPLGSGLISRWMWDLDDTEYDLSRSNPDIAFVEALIDHIGATLCIDRARVYVTGHSNGAIGASALGCVLEDRIAAIAPVAALTDFGDACELEGPVPVLGVHGAADPYVLLEGGWGEGAATLMLEDFIPFTEQPIASWPGFSTPIADRAAGIAARNGCEPEPGSEAIGSDAERLTWTCPPGGEVELVVITAGGHAWPVTPVAATELIWEFFSRHALPAVS